MGEKEGNRKWDGVMLRIVFFFAVLVIVPYLVLVVILYAFFQNYTVNRLGEATMDTLSAAAAGIRNALNEQEDNSMALYYNDCVDFLSKDLTLNEQEKKKINDILNAECYSNTEVIAAYLLTEQEIFHSGRNYEKILPILENYREEIVNANGACRWYATDDLYGKAYNNVFVLARSLNSRREDNVGLLFLILSDQMFDDAFGEVSTEYTDWCVTDLNGEVLYSTDAQKVGTKKDISMLNRNRKQSYQRVKDRCGGDRILSSYTLMDVGWYCISETGIRSMRMAALTMAWPLLIVSLIYIVFLAVMLRMMKKYVFHPLRALKRSMDEYAQEELGETRIEIYGIGEFRSLSSHFNHMTLRISNLMKAYKKEEEEKNRQKLQTLAAQLTPHFIYNALNTIKWVAVLNHQEKIQNLVEALVKIFMNAARPDDGNYTLREELELIESYAVIQKARFMNFELDIDAPSDCMGCRICKLLVQPVVENAIVHGLNRGKIHNGIIRIRVWREDKLHISVTDHGVGFDVETWSHAPDRKEGHTNIGLHNIEEIIRLEYGEGYGIEIKSAPGRGTEILYELPVIMKNRHSEIAAETGISQENKGKKE